MRRTFVLGAAFFVLASYASAQIVNESYANPMNLVDHWYQTFLHRSALADPSSYGWAQQLRQGSDPDAVLAAILSSAEYYARGGNTPTGFVQDLFVDIDGRQPTAPEFQYWMQRAYAQNISDPEVRKDIAFDFLTQSAPTLPWNDLHWSTQGERHRALERERAHFDYRQPRYTYHR